MNTTFVGRKKELSQLNLLLNKKSASLVVVKGRRWIGKSRLIGMDFKRTMPRVCKKRPS